MSPKLTVATSEILFTIPQRQPSGLAQKINIDRNAASGDRINSS